jgi:hypothetical protein
MAERRLKRPRDPALPASHYGRPWLDGIPDDAATNDLTASAACARSGPGGHRRGAQNSDDGGETPPRARRTGGAHLIEKSGSQHVDGGEMAGTRSPLADAHLQGYPLPLHAPKPASICRRPSVSPLKPRMRVSIALTDASLHCLPR